MTRPPASSLPEERLPAKRVNLGHPDLAETAYIAKDMAYLCRVLGSSVADFRSAFADLHYSKKIGSDQCSIPNAQFLSEQSERLAIRHPLRLRIAHWELNIGQILGLMLIVSHLRSSEVFSPFRLSSGGARGS